MKKFALQFTDWRWKDQYVISVDPSRWVNWTKDSNKAKQFDTFEEARLYHETQNFNAFVEIVQVWEDYSAYERAMKGI